eukprot:gene9268-19240_t
MGFLDFLKKRDREARVLVLGLDNAGKTSILAKLSDANIDHISPTNGYNIKTLVHDLFKLTMWDLGGQKSLRTFWKNYFESTHALIYVIDSTDRRRMEETGVELHSLLEEPKLFGIPVLIYANKQDLLHALSADDISRGLGLVGIRDRPWHISPCSAKNGTGLADGLEFLIRELDDDKKFATK